MAGTADRDPREPTPVDPRMDAAERDEIARLRAMSPGERLAEAIELSRVATRLATSAPDSRS